MNAPVGELLKQHLIDPEICIRCNTCEETCPVDAVTHDGNNYVVDASICNHCMDCISPCPTGSIDNWRVVAKPYTLEEQYSWSELPAPSFPKTAAGKALMSATGILLAGGIAIAVVVPLFIATAKAEFENTSTTSEQTTFVWNRFSKMTCITTWLI